MEAPLIGDAQMLIIIGDQVRIIGQMVMVEMVARWKHLRMNKKKNIG